MSGWNRERERLSTCVCAFVGPRFTAAVVNGGGKTPMKFIQILTAKRSPTNGPSFYSIVL